MLGNKKENVILWSTEVQRMTAKNRKILRGYKLSDICKIKAEQTQNDPSTPINLKKQKRISQFHRC